MIAKSALHWTATRASACWHMTISLSDSRLGRPLTDMGKLGRSRCDRALHSCLSCHETPVPMPLVVWSCGVGNVCGNSGAVLDTDACHLCCMLVLRFAKFVTQSGIIRYTYAMTEKVPPLQLQPMLATCMIHTSIQDSPITKLLPMQVHRVKWSPC